MSISDKINEDIKQAMLAREKDKLEALRAVKTAFTLAMAETGGHELNEDTELKILQKLVKQRKESADVYLSQNRKDLADSELFQAACISTYLPAQMPDEELTRFLCDIIAETGAAGIKDFGKVMGIASARLSGRADNKTVSAKLRELLGSS